jgi:hypothetical protein
MNVIAHTARLASNGAVVPETIDTGQAGLAADLVVHPFRARQVSSTDVSSARGPGWWWGSGVVLLVGGLAVLRRRRTPSRSA